MKVIFLDIDGVLNTENWIDACVLENEALGEAKNIIHDEFGHVFDPTAVKYLSGLVNKHQAKIVISSSWRYSGMPFFQKIWKDRELPGEVIGLTFCNALDKDEYFKQKEELVKITNPKESRCRGHEIQAYLNCHPEIENYVILDDDCDMLESQKDHFVHCNYLYGVDFKVYHDANSILSNPDLAK